MKPAPWGAPWSARSGPAWSSKDLNAALPRALAALLGIVADGALTQGRATMRVSEDMATLGPGDPIEIGGHRLVGRLGAGGMGVVYRALTADGDPVAIKVIRDEYADDPEFRRRRVPDRRRSKRA